MRMFTLAFALLAASLAAQAAPREFADQRALDAEAKLSVRNVAGLVEIEAWNKPLMAVSGQLDESVEKVDISGSAGEMKVEVKNRKSSGSWSDHGDTRLKLFVPSGVSLNVDGTSADIVVRGTRGTVVARSVSGDIDLAVAALDIDVQTVSGDLRLDSPAARQTRLNTVSGDADVKGAAGVLSAESVSGDLSLVGGSFTRLDLKSVSGDIEVRAAFATDAAVKAESLSGDVRVDAPASLSAQVSLKTFSGDRNCEFEAAQKTSDSKRSMLKIGEGRGQLSLTSFSGDVTLDRQ